MRGILVFMLSPSLHLEYSLPVARMVLHLTVTRSSQLLCQKRWHRAHTSAYLTNSRRLLFFTVAFVKSFPVSKFPHLNTLVVGAF